MNGRSILAVTSTMSRSTIPRHQVLRIMAGCVKDDDQAAAIQALIDQPERYQGPPLDGALVAHLTAMAMGNADSWQAITAMRPDLADLDWQNIPIILDRLFTDQHGDKP